MRILTELLSRNRRKPVADNNGVLYALDQSDRGWELPRGYSHACGLLVWKVTNHCFGIYRGVARGWEFLTVEQWRERYFTDPPTWLDYAGMAILRYALRRNRHANPDFENISRDTLLVGVQRAVRDHRRHLKAQAAQPQPATR